MKTRSSSQFVIITVFAMVILSVNGYQMKFAFSQDEETPDFGGTKAPFSPLPENERSPPPPPSNATQVNELPKNLFVEENDTDSEPLVIANKTELLEVLPANATSVIEFIDSSLKNSTGQGLLPPGIMNNVTDAGQLNASSSPSGEKQNITTILDFLNKENLIKEVLPLISPANKSATSEDLEEIVEPQQPSNVSENATTPEEQPASENATTPEEQPVVKTLPLQKNNQLVKTLRLQKNNHREVKMLRLQKNNHLVKTLRLQKNYHLTMKQYHQSVKSLTNNFRQLRTRLRLPLKNLLTPQNWHLQTIPNRDL